MQIKEIENMKKKFGGLILLNFSYYIKGYSDSR